MTKRQESKFNMYNAVITFINSDPTIPPTIPAFATAFTAFQATIASLAAAAQSEMEVITGVTIDKATLRNNLCIASVEIADAVFAYATSVSNNTLAEQVRTSLSELKKIKDDLLGPKCLNIHQAASDNSAAIVPFGVTAAMLTALDTLITAYTAAVPTPRNAVALRKVYREQIVQLIKDADSNLKTQMDKLVVQFKTTHPDFYDTYLQNRVIVNAATNATKIRGTILNGTDDSPLAGVEVTVEGTELSAVTNNKDRFTIKGLTPGTFNVKMIKLGFVTKTVEGILVKLGKPSNLNTSIAPAA